MRLNFNNDKGTDEVYGFQDGDESWEFKNNTSNRTLFKSDDFTSTVVDGDGNVVPAWLDDFEGRYPDGSEDATNLSKVSSWVVSTDQSVATGASITPVTYDGVTYTNDTAEYRIAKFKAEFEDWFELDAMTFFYVFTETFLMVDNRAKNMFLTKMADSKWFILPYDFDTAIGINNEGALVFSYNLEDIDTVDGADVYNGQKSTLWINFRQVFYNNIKDMYATIRNSGGFSYAVVEKMFEDHQSKWPEAVFNEDSYYKYLAPLVNPEDGHPTNEYLKDLQGSKAEQRKWWLYNRFKYLDSKYNTGDALNDNVSFRGYAKSDITVTPYADVYASIKYGSYLVQARATRNESYTLTCPLDNVNDTEIAIYSVSQLSSFGDLSGLKIGSADFSRATKLVNLKVGDSSRNYSNPNLLSLSLGSNALLKTLDARNCTNLSQSIDLSRCTNIEEIYLSGTIVPGVSLPNGGNLKTIVLPSTVTNLTVRNQPSLSYMVLPNPAALTTLRIENTPVVVDNPGSRRIQLDSILNAMTDRSRIRLIGFDITCTSVEQIEALYDNFDRMLGIDENGNNIPTPQVSGTIHINSISSPQYNELKARYNNIEIEYDNVVYAVTFYNDTEVIRVQSANSGETITYNGATPTKTPTNTLVYTFAGWSSTNGGEIDPDILSNITEDRNAYAVFTEGTRYYTINFYNDGTLMQTSQYEYGDMPVYTGATPTRTDTNYQFIGWLPAIDVVTSDVDYIARYKSLYSPLIGVNWNGTLNKSSVTSLTFIKDYDPASYDAYWDASYRGDETVMAYATGTDVVITWSDTLTLACVANSSRMFAGCSKITSLDLTLLDTSNVTTMQAMFSGCTNLTTVDVSTFNTSSVTTMRSMFSGCSKLTAIDISGFNLSSVTDMTDMFYGCSAVTSMLFNPSVVGWAGCDIDLGSMTAIGRTNAVATLTSLPAISSAHTIYMPNVGLTTAEKEIATSKGWTVIS